ncbi:hypothetical protein DACRYDRAFT_119844 [Dacryopinax primogenitus]|uniref:Mini-chromosome maintenance complex-binding protein n=1 Tax=Dacryopinax primogenitus (strain DJM 731) TaxID=1858805 RepID=M5FZ54_DACPD|nr:uncharacterized protein DACRYDRAFT_119844 [Dacryopinax primogenitus]EJT96772.1 hypothetical protein DACRYDRAFT_119844 [Dacryopinax primogenitus]
MVTAALSDALSNPLSVINDLQSQSNPHARITAHFRSLFPDDQKIPLLDVHHPPASYPSGSLVRFRGMIQDTSISPEIYVSHLGYGLDSLPAVNGGFDMGGMREALGAVESGGGGAGLGVGIGGRGTQWEERGVVWAVNVPGESAWVEKSTPGLAASPQPTLMAHKFPLPHTPHIGLLVKSYPPAEFKPSAVHSFVGILTFEPRLNHLHDDEQEAELPSLHVVFHSPAQDTLVKAVYPMPPARGRSGAEVKEEIVRYLAETTLGGDMLAAEYVLLCCIARVQSRTPFLPPPTLLLSHSSPTTTAALRSCLEELFPIVVHVPLSIAYLNDTPFAPSSSVREEDEDLRSGVLQLAPGTVVLVDEHGVGEGKLGDLGVRNIATMQATMTAQTLAYAFPFSSYEFPTDLSFVVLCSGPKSPFFTTDITLPLRPASSSPTPAPLTPDQATEYRLWLAGCKSQSAGKNVHIGKEIAEYIQGEFVRERKEGLTADDLSLRMSLAKLEAYLRHETEITKEVWECVVALEKERKSALA